MPLALRLVLTFLFLFSLPSFLQSIFVAFFSLPFFAWLGLNVVVALPCGHTASSDIMSERSRVKQLLCQIPTPNAQVSSENRFRPPHMYVLWPLLLRPHDPRGAGLWLSLRPTDVPHSPAMRLLKLNQFASCVMLSFFSPTQ